MGKGEFLTNREVQAQVQATLDKKAPPQAPLKPPLPPGAQAIVNQTRADYEKTFGTPAPEIIIEPTLQIGTVSFTCEPSVSIRTHAGNEEEEKLANAIAMRLATSNTASVTQRTIPKPSEPPTNVRVHEETTEEKSRREEDEHNWQQYLLYNGPR
jgi:hypothetical protein